MTILITGATGFVGSAFLARLLRSADFEGGKVFALARGANAADRLERALARALNAAGRSDVSAADLMAGITLLQGDVAAPDFNLCPADLALLDTARVSQIWHIASDLSPEGWEANVAAARALAAMAERLQVTRVHYLSTAYVTGQGVTECPVTASVTGVTRFNNDYERGKHAAEVVLAEAARLQGWALSILRPSIITGARASKLPGGSASALYGVVQVLAQEAARQARHGARRITLLCGDGDLNLVGIDRVVDQMIAAQARSAIAGGARTEARFIGGSNLPVRLVVAALSDRLGLEIACTPNPADLPEADLRLNARLAFFLPYTRRDNRKVFHGEDLPEADRIYEIDLLNLIEAARNETAHGPLMDRLRLLHLPRADGSRLVAYANRDFSPARPTAVIVNAYGMPVNVLHPLIAGLAGQGFNTLTWDCRGLPDTGFDMNRPALSVADHAGDFDLVTRAFGVARVALLGWSTGAVVASHIAAHAPARVESLSLLNGSFMHPGATLTLFQQNLASIMPKVALSPGVAAMLYNSVFKEDRTRFVKLMTRDISRKANEAMSVTEPQHKHIVQALTAGPDQVFRYARLIRAFVKENPLLWLGRITAPTRLFTGPADITAHPQGSVEAREAIPGASLHIEPGTSHLALFDHPAFLAAVLGFVAHEHSLQTQLKKVA
ncbi:MAG: alpha/beta fold hydrolase [Gemmobacter sp.]|uniref:alpha/beta fold hydrolase n=1 Tax=Gemmobacter sp. TaxID=1898957 RepID=UPI001A585812|nr:alpha/beta fold hydrolase [Gemmobacter sp.]MBL8560809.1 alpha/beta fold hydrolase [Gemmobacter sp.]